MSDAAAIDKWVARVNKAAAELDDAAASIHPSAWSEALLAHRDKFEKAAKSGPKEKS